MRKNIIAIFTKIAFQCNFAENPECDNTKNICFAIMVLVRFSANKMQKNCNNLLHFLQLIRAII